MEPGIMQVNLIEGLPFIFQLLIQMLIILVPTSIVGLVLYIRLSKFRIKEKYELKEIRRVSKKATEYIYGLLGDINDYVASSMVNDEINRQYEESISKKFHRLEGLMEFQSDRTNERLNEMWGELQSSFATDVYAILMLQKGGVLVEKVDLDKGFNRFFSISHEFVEVLNDWAIET
jgi:hypothetical protein